MSRYEAESFALALSNVLKFCPKASKHPYVQVALNPAQCAFLTADRYAIAWDSARPTEQEDSGGKVILHREQAAELEAWLRALGRREVYVRTESHEAEGDTCYLFVRTFDETTSEWIEEGFNQPAQLEPKWVTWFEWCAKALSKASEQKPLTPPTKSPSSTWYFQPHRLTALAGVRVPGVAADDKVMEITPMEGVSSLRVALGPTFRALLQPVTPDDSES